MPENPEQLIQPIQIKGVSDYHVHCEYSIDAEGTIAEYCEAALKRDLAEICFTTHYDFDPNSNGRVNFIRIKGEKKPTTIDNLAAYVDEVNQMAEIYYLKGLSVKLGVEIGWHRGCEEEVEKLCDRYHFDYVLCGIHDIDSKCFCCHSTFEDCFDGMSMEDMVGKYFELTNDAVNSNLFHTIAHLGYYIKYGKQYYGDKILTAHEPFIHDTFKNLKKNDISLEINTAAVRHGIGDYYPFMSLINKAKKVGVKVIHLGSDAHKPEQIGYDFEMADSLVPSNITGCEG